MSHFPNTITTVDRLQLHTQQWLIDKPNAFICLVHGLGEHAGRYQHVAAFLNDRGFSVIAYDVRGHGKSEGQKGHAPRYELLHDDIQSCVNMITNHSEKNTPLFMYGHSLGGLQVISYLLSRQPKNIAGAIVTSPALQPAFTAPAWKLLLAKASVKILPSLSVSNEIDVSHISRDPEVIKAYQADDFVHNRISAGLGLSILVQGEWALAHSAHLHCPMLLMHGNSDRITSCEASETFAENAGKICTFKKWEGLFHETHNEPEKQQVLSEMARWLESQL